MSLKTHCLCHERRRTPSATEGHLKNLVCGFEKYEIIEVMCGVCQRLLVSDKQLCTKMPPCGWAVVGAFFFRRVWCVDQRLVGDDLVALCLCSRMTWQHVALLWIGCFRCVDMSSMTVSVRHELQCIHHSNESHHAFSSRALFYYYLDKEDSAPAPRRPYVLLFRQ